MYNRCLNTADLNRWDGFSCGQCSVSLKITDEEMLSDAEAIISRLLVTCFKNARREDGGMWPSD